MRTIDEIHSSITNKLKEKVNDDIRTGSLIDIYNNVIADEIHTMYDEIENAKNPHLFTNTHGDELDSLGYWVTLPRKDNESDEDYKYRLKDWELSNEASNTTAIANALLDLTYASNVDYVPNTHGSGTATCYIIPTSYDDSIITSALKETEERIKSIVSPSLYVEYIVPSIRAVKLSCFLQASGSDENLIKNNIITAIKAYINAIAPGSYIKTGDMIKLGLAVDGVEYFNIMEIFIDNEPVSDLNVIQELETKFLFDTIEWSGV